MSNESNHAPVDAVREPARENMLERAIPAAEVPTDPLRCPSCGKRNITLIGNITRGFTERLENGEVVEQTLADGLERETSAVECRDCKIRFLVMTPEETELLAENDDLYEELITSSSNLIKPANKLDC